MKYLTLLLIFCGFSCKTPNNIKQNTNKTYDDDFVLLQRGGCFGTCPIYEITLYANGKINYKGKAYTDYIGFYTGQIDPQIAYNLFNKIKTYNWAAYPEKYPIDNVDFPQFQLSYNTKKIQKTIKGNNRADTELIELTKELDGFVKKAELKLIE
ncbi:MAG: hypothetical protein KDE33_21740 [Bacteroidetes bacterium]|nr:hypothetical protein [Bacteroidota bacterium]MCB9226059.1 hypothetical protein [Chitinophagales bacterium]